MRSIQLIRGASIAVILMAAFAIGFASGVAPARAVQVSIIAYVNPGVATSSSSINCHWHGTTAPCPNAGDLQALDWSQTANSTVRYAAWTYRSYPASGTYTTYNAIKNLNNSLCRRVRMDVVTLTGVVKASEFYTHTKLSGSSGYSYAIPGSTSVTKSTFGPIGTTVAPYSMSNESGTDLSTCTSTGAHLHQGASSMARNTGTFTGTGAYTGLQDLAKWQHHVSWTE